MVQRIFGANIKKIEKSGAYRINAFGNLVATYGIAECPKSIGIQTLVQWTNDLNLKMIGRELQV